MTLFALTAPDRCIVSLHDQLAIRTAVVEARCHVSNLPLTRIHSHSLPIHTLSLSILSPPRFRLPFSLPLPHSPTRTHTLRSWRSIYCGYIPTYIVFSSVADHIVHAHSTRLGDGMARSTLFPFRSARTQ